MKRKTFNSRDASLAVGAVAVLVCLAGCAAIGAPSGRTLPQPSLSAQQREALRDGVISWEEYEATFDAYVACLDRRGFELVDVRVEEDFFTFGVPGAAVDTGVDDECYGRHWSRVDDAWQIAHENTSGSARVVSACLRSLEVVPSAGYQENLDLLKRHGVELSDCPADD